MKRRRRENKTDYKLRVNLLKSGVDRVVVRRTNKYFIVQAVKSGEAQDSVIATANSRELLRKGWDAKKDGSLKSIPAGYLTGLLLTKKLALKGIHLEGAKIPKGHKTSSRPQKNRGRNGKYIVDLGMARTLSGSRIFSVVKGLVDGGLGINVKEKVFPSEERLNGEHLKEDMKVMISKVKECIK